MLRAVVQQKQFKRTEKLMSYKLNNVDIITFGAMPVTKGPGIALEGIFDMPKRKGQTEYNWGTSIEPFVSAEDIELDGRELGLNVVIHASDKQTLVNRINAFKTACIDCTVLSFDYDSFNVICRSDIKVVEYDLVATISAVFWQDAYILKPLTLIASNSGSFRIDNYNLQSDFGIIISKTEGLRDIANRIEINTTELYTKTQHREQRSITLSCFAKSDSIAMLYENICQFHSLCCMPGFRTLTLPENSTIQLYFKEGSKAQFIADKLVKFTLKATVND